MVIRLSRCMLRRILGHGTMFPCATWAVRGQDPCSALRPALTDEPEPKQPTDDKWSSTVPTDSAKPEIGCLKVSSKSSPASVAGAIAGMIKDGSVVEVQAVGAGAVNQAVKAIAISRGFLSPIGIEIVCVPAFADIVIDGEYRTAIRFSVERRTGALSDAAAIPLAEAVSA